MMINEMEIYFYVVEYNSFSKAAQHLEVSSSYISKKINKLEQSLGVNLLTRSTRKISVTEAGNAFYQQCAQVVAQAQRGYDMMAELQGNVTGTLKIAAPIAFGCHCLPPVIEAFSKQHPNVNLQLHLSSQLVDVIAGGFDLVLRSATLESSNLIAQKLSDTHSSICASPAYWSAQGLPEKPQDLTSYYWATYGRSGHSKVIKLQRGSQQYPVTIPTSIVCSSLDAIKAFTLNGTCAAILPNFMVQDELTSGKLISALATYAMTPSPLYILYPKRDHIPPKVTVFIEQLKRHMQKTDQP